jgi:hypothetical protein
MSESLDQKTEKLYCQILIQNNTKVLRESFVSFVSKSNKIITSF